MRMKEGLRVPHSFVCMYIYGRSVSAGKPLHYLDFRCSLTTRSRELIYRDVRPRGRVGGRR
jgi:hypothetical protein